MAVDVLDEEQRPTGRLGLALVSKLKTLHDDNQRFYVPDKFSANKFGVKHYAEVFHTLSTGGVTKSRRAAQ